MFQKEQKLYSPLYRDVFLEEVLGDLIYAYVVSPEDPKDYQRVRFNKLGQASFMPESLPGVYVRYSKECLLFPSEDNKDWSNYGN